MWRIRHTKHFRPELQFHALRDLEVAKDAGIQVEETGSPDDIAASRAEAYLSPRNRTEGSRVEVVARQVRGSTAHALPGYWRGSNATEDT